MEDVKALQKKILLILALVDVVFVTLGFIFLKAPIPFALGVIFGSAISGLNFLELGNTLTKAVNMSPDKAQSFATRKYFVRYIVSAVVIFISVVAPYINVLGTVLGLITIKFIILATNLFNDKQYYKNILKRKEDEPSGR